MKLLLIGLISILSTVVWSSSEQFSIGERVIQTEGRIGTVSAINPSKSKVVIVKFDVLNAHIEMKKSYLAHTNGCTKNNFCVGQGVISTEGYTGKITGVFNNGKVMVKFDRISDQVQMNTNYLALSDDLQ